MKFTTLLKNLKQKTTKVKIHLWFFAVFFLVFILVALPNILLATPVYSIDIISTQYRQDSHVPLRTNKSAEANRLFNEGVDQYGKSQFQQALKSFQKASAIYREIGDRPNLGETLSIIGNIYYNIVQYKQAVISCPAG